MKSSEEVKNDAIQRCLAANCHPSTRPEINAECPKNTTRIPSQARNIRQDTDLRRI